MHIIISSLQLKIAGVYLVFHGIVTDLKKSFVAAKLSSEIAKFSAHKIVQ